MEEIAQRKKRNRDPLAPNWRDSKHFQSDPEPHVTLLTPRKAKTPQQIQHLSLINSEKAKKAWQPKLIPAEIIPTTFNEIEEPKVPKKFTKSKSTLKEPPGYQNLRRSAIVFSFCHLYGAPPESKWDSRMITDIMRQYLVPERLREDVLECLRHALEDFSNGNHFNPDF